MMTKHADGPGLFRTPWFMPVFCLVLGALSAGALALGGQRSSAVFSLILFAVIAALLALGGRSETVRQLRGDGRDERWARIDLAATALSGLVLITVIIAACFYEWAHGRDGSPYAQLGALAGVSYVAALAILTRRS
jgi:hypothetical protein